MGTRFTFLTLCVFLSASAKAAIIPFPFTFFDDFVMTEDSFEGDWKEHASWQGPLCQGGYSYSVSGHGKIDGLDMQMRKDYIDAKANLTGIVAAVSGSYRSELSLCKRLSHLLDAEADHLVVSARIWLDDKDGNLNVKVRILNSQIHRIYFSRYFPAFLERFLTRVVNRSMNYIWTTRLGDWIGDKVGEVMKDNFPGGARVSVQ